MKWIRSIERTSLSQRCLLILLLCGSLILIAKPLAAQVVTVEPVFPKVHDDVTVTFHAAEGNGALLGVAPVYAHAGLITSESTSPSDWKHVQGVWGTPDPNVLMQNQGNNTHTISYNIHDYYGVNDGEIVESLAFVFRNASGSIVGRAADNADIFYPVYPDDVDFLSILLSPQEPSLALFEGEKITVKGATSQDADLSITDNGQVLTSSFGNSLEYELEVTSAGNHQVEFVAIRGTDTLTQSFFYTVIVDVTVENPPAGYEMGYTMTSPTSALFQLYAPGKSFVHLIGDATSWAPQSQFQMKRSIDGNIWWLTVEDLTPDELYRYQYIVNGTLRIGDPYSTLILDPFDDGFIDAATFPNKPPYPAGLTTGQVTCMVQSPVSTTPTLQPKRPNSELIIYELLLRDFLAAHSFQVLEDTLDYLQRLGVNAIELMPVNEFEGNLGWGYNPSYHMALDKYYGPADAFRSLIEACHARGMAVILDVVYNHAFGQSPFAQLYWDAANSRPSADNPWLNPVAKHDFNVGFDFNHESAATKYFVKRVIAWWMETYGIDGFRFDLSKGFTQNNTLGDIAGWGHYDQSRINIWQEYADYIRSIDPEAYIILEHFADNDEEQELASRGMMLWGNMNSAYSQASMGYGGSDLSRIWHETRGWNDPHLVGYMESHDEERIMYRNLNSGNSAPDYNIKNLNTALSRIELLTPFFYLIPGPKMIWEFGELGFEFSINRCPDGTINNNCRLDPKPIRWDYLDVLLRRRVYDVTRAIIQLREENAWKEGTLTISLVNQFEKKLQIRHADMDIIAAGNFFVGDRNIAPGFTRTGMWYDYLTGDSLEVHSMDTSFAFSPGDFHVYTTRRIDLGFDITTSIRPDQIIRLEADIRPTLNQGEFFIYNPDLNPASGDLWITDLQGRKVQAVIEPILHGVQVKMTSPVPGMYLVQWTKDHILYTGKIVVHP